MHMDLSGLRSGTSFATQLIATCLYNLATGTCHILVMLLANVFNPASLLGVGGNLGRCNSCDY